MNRIAHFRKVFFKPTETFIYNYLTSAQDFEPIVITFKRERKEQFPLNIPVVELYRWDFIATFYRRLKKKMFRNSSQFTFDKNKTYRTINKYNVDLLHAHFGYTGVQLLSIKEHTGIPLITTFYGEDVSALATQAKWKDAYEKLFDKGNLFLVEGPHMREKIIELGCPSEKIQIQRIAIKTDQYPFRVRTPKDNGEAIKILFCGTFREKKGLIYALKAIKKIKRDYSELEFIVIGDGPERDKIRQYVEQNSMESYVHFKGFLNHSQMIKEMDKADIFIHPSVTGKDGNSEGGAPTVILEAQACGLPILSTTHADIPYIVKDEISGLLSPERDTEQLALNIEILLNEQHRWKKMGEKGRQHIESYHDIHKESHEIEQKYFQLLTN